MYFSSGSRHGEKNYGRQQQRHEVQYQLQPSTKYDNWYEYINTSKLVTMKNDRQQHFKEKKQEQKQHQNPNLLQSTKPTMKINNEKNYNDIYYFQRLIHNNKTYRTNNSNKIRIHIYPN